MNDPPDAPPFGPPAEVGEVGTLGRFRVVAELGRGGMGVVYRGFDTRLHRPVALKVMPPGPAASRTARERFVREARAAARITHDNVLAVLDAGEIDGVPFIALPLLQGYPLDEFLRRKGPPSVPQAVRIGREIALGLAAAHALGVIHRDVKPGNVWLEAPHGRVKLLDFGLAKPADEGHDLTHAGAVLGTPAYMAPEQAAGEKVDHRADLYSLGTVLYRLLAGRTPFEPARDALSLFVALAADEPPPLRGQNAAVPPDLAALVHELLRKKRDERPPSAAAVAKRLGRMLKAAAAADAGPAPVEERPVAPPPAYIVVPVTAPPPGAFDQIAGRPPPPRKSLAEGYVWLAAAAVLVGLAVWIVNALVSSPQSSAEPKPVKKAADDPRPPAAGRAAEPVSIAKPPPGVWVSLTAGKTLADWQPVGPVAWTAAGGVFRADGPDVGWIGTTFDVTDYELEFEYRQPPGGQAGVLLRGWEFAPADGGDCVQLRLADPERLGHLPPARRNGAILFQAAPAVPPATPPGRWHKVAVRVTGTYVTAVFNDVTCFAAHVDFPRPAGRIGLLQDRTPVEFRNVRVRGLGWVGPAGPWDDLFPADERPLFARRWEMMGPVRQVRARDAAVAVEGPPAAWLRTKKAYTDFEIGLEFKPAPRAAGGVLLRTTADGDGPPAVEVVLADDRPDLDPNRLTGSVLGEGRRRGDPKLNVGGWNALRVRVAGRRVVVAVNGVECVDREVARLAAAGSIGLRAAESGLEFRGVSVRELKE